MAEKMTPYGLVVGLIIEPNEADVENEGESVQETPSVDKPKRGRKPKTDD